MNGFEYELRVNESKSKSKESKLNEVKKAHTIINITEFWIFPKKRSVKDTDKWEKILTKQQCTQTKRHFFSRMKCFFYNDVPIAAIHRTSNSKKCMQRST